MDISNVIVIVVNFLLIALLPVIFFRRDGKLTLMWLATAAPFGIAPVLVLMAYRGYWLELLVNTASPLYSIMAAFATLISIMSIGLIFMTLGTHRVPLALWHQQKDNDKPSHIVTWGSYKYVRHPFYSAFLLTFVATFLMAPHWIILALATYMALLLNYTAQREEQRLSKEPGPVGSEYREYVQITGRFIPKFRRHDETLETHVS